MNDNFIWAEKQLATMNSNCLFLLDIVIEKEQTVKFDITANGLYKLYLDGSLRLYGPARTAKGYCRMDKKAFRVKEGTHRVAVIASAYNVASYSIMKDTPYFYCRVMCEGKTYDSRDFKCYDFSPRIKNVQRYSYQRGFCEQYVQKADLKEYFNNPRLLGGELEKVYVKAPKVLPRTVPYPHLYKVQTKRPIQSGTFVKDDGLPVWEDRAITQVGDNFEGYYKSEQSECLANTVSRFVYNKGKAKTLLSDLEYSVYDFKRNVSGFIGAKISVRRDAEVYLTFDEITGGKDSVVDFKRLNCTNVIKWQLKKGEYDLQSIEPYTMRYAQINVLSGEAEIHGLYVVPVENKDAFRLTFKVNDKVIESILSAARNTVAQNSQDLLMDCPSRERAGWINDIYYSRNSATTFTGSFKVLKATLENYAIAEHLPELPEKMIPMCYPSDHINGEYIPNCAIWYVIIMCEYILNSGDKRLKRLARPQIKGIMEFFEGYENSDSLLENLESWVFIEWSEANSKDFVCGVNYPTNMMYYKMLTTVNKLWHTKNLSQKSEKIKKNILKQSFNGEFFEDNRVRINGRLKSLNHISEACQYHAFFSGVATKETHPELYKKLYNVFVPSRNKQEVYPNIDKANVITGLMMRLTMLIEYGEVEKALNETVEIYGKMSEKTGTLWENVHYMASCNHGIAAYAGSIVIAALTGFTGYYRDKPQFNDKFVGVDCEFFFPWEKGGVRVTVENGKRYIKEIK